MNLNTARVFVRDIKEAKSFYSAVLGLPVKFDGSEHGYCVFDAGATALVVEYVDGEDKELIGRFTGLSFDVPNANASYEQLRSKGVTFTELPERQPWGGVIATLVDPSGNKLQISERPILEAVGLETSHHRVRFAVMFEDGPGMPEVRQSRERDHLEFLNTHRPEIPMAGALRDERGGPCVGGLWVLEVPGRERAVELIERDPYYMACPRKYRLFAWGKALPNVQVLM